MHTHFFYLLFLSTFFIFLFFYFRPSPHGLGLTQLTQSGHWSRPVTRTDGRRAQRTPAHWIIIHCYCSSELKCKRNGAYLNAGTEMITEAWWSSVLFSSALLCLWFSFSFAFSPGSGNAEGAISWLSSARVLSFCRFSLFAFCLLFFKMKETRQWWCRLSIVLGSSLFFFCRDEDKYSRADLWPSCAFLSFSV